MRGDPGGSEAILDRARKVNPQLRVIMTSEDELELPQPSLPGIHILEKPFDAARLEAAVKAALE